MALTPTEIALVLFLFQKFEEFRMNLADFTAKLNAATVAANANKTMVDALKMELAAKATFIDPASLDDLGVTVDTIAATVRPV